MAIPRLPQRAAVSDQIVGRSAGPSHYDSVGNKARYNRQTLRRSSRVQWCTGIGKVIPSRYCVTRSG